MPKSRHVDDDTQPSGLPDRALLQIYLEDHLTGATGIVQRLTMMRDSYQDLPVATELTRLLEEVTQDRQTLVEVIGSLGLRPSPAKLLLARGGELVGRLKLNGRLRQRSPLTPLLELEVLQAGINGKSGLWRSLAVHADALGLDPEQFRSLEERARRQQDDVVAAHRRLVRGAFG